MSKDLQSLSEFYPYYLTEHSNVINRRLHYIGTFLVICSVTYAILTGNPWFLLYALPQGYGFAWVGHFFFEGNKPATFKYPSWSLVSDFHMFYDFLTMQVDDKLAAAQKKHPRQK